jgi:MFS family permease
MPSRSDDKLGLSQNGAITDKPIGRLKNGHWMEPWYLSYALLGCTMGGMIPILVPLLAFKRFSSACHVGLVMAAFNLGGLMTPIFGSVADRFGIHRELLSGALIMTAIALGALSFANTFALWLALAF